MEEKRTGLFENGLIWFGAGVSIAEILTGTYLAPLGMGKGLAAIIVAHHWLSDAVPGRSDRRKSQKECNGDCKDELWTEGKYPFCGPECVAACRLDCDHDL